MHEYATIFKQRPISNTVKDTNETPPMDRDLHALCNAKKLDEQTIRNLFQESRSLQKFSYIPYVVRVSYEIPDLRKHTTLEILEFLDKLFCTPQYYQKEIQSIGLHLKTRDDLFQAFLLLAENKPFKDELHYWHPDLEFTNVFSFICDLFSDISSLFLLYISQNLIVDYHIHYSLIEMLENKLPVSTMTQISIMKKDIEVFKKDVQHVMPKTNLPVSGDTVFCHRIISHTYWTEVTCKPFSFFEIEQPKHKDRVYFLCSCFSMVEVEFVGTRSVTLLVTLKALEDLLLREEHMKWYWVELGIVDQKWNFVV